MDSVERVIASMGCVISIEHKAAMQSSLPLLQKNYKFSKVVFWGKLLGKTKDYLVCQGIGNSYTGSKLTFYCTDGVSWAQLPAPAAELKTNVGKLPAGTFLTGDPSFVYTITIPKDPEAAEEEAAEEGEDAGIKFSEESRLSYIIDLIDTENAMVPKGALMMKASGEVVENFSWMGLQPTAASAIENYCFLNKAAPKDIFKTGMTNALDFLVGIDTLVPKGSWSVHCDECTGTYTIRSLLYPGFVGYCVPGTKTWGNCYIGDGEKNLDIAFMLP